jgi:hypothetical protein
VLCYQLVRLLAISLDVDNVGIQTGCLYTQTHPPRRSRRRCRRHHQHKTVSHANFGGRRGKGQGIRHRPVTLTRVPSTWNAGINGSRSGDNGIAGFVGGSSQPLAEDRLLLVGTDWLLPRATRSHITHRIILNGHRLTSCSFCILYTGSILRHTLN